MSEKFISEQINRTNTDEGLWAGTLIYDAAENKTIKDAIDEIVGATGTVNKIQKDATGDINNPSTVNFTGSGVSISDVGGVATVNIPGSTGGTGTVNNVGKLSETPVANPTHIIFDGAGVAVEQIVIGGSGIGAKVTIPGSTGSSLTVQKDGAGDFTADTINFEGDNISVTQDPTGTAKVSIIQPLLFSFTADIDGAGLITITGIPDNITPTWNSTTSVLDLDFTDSKLISYFSCSETIAPPDEGIEPLEYNFKDMLIAITTDQFIAKSIMEETGTGTKIYKATKLKIYNLTTRPAQYKITLYLMNGPTHDFN